MVEESTRKPSWQEVVPRRSEAMASLETGDSETTLAYLNQLKQVIEEHFSLVTDRAERGQSAPVEEAWLLGGITFPLLTWFNSDCEQVTERGLQPPEINQDLMKSAIYHFPGFSLDRGIGFAPRYVKVLCPPSRKSRLLHTRCATDTAHR